MHTEQRKQRRLGRRYPGETSSLEGVQTDGYICLPLKLPWGLISCTPSPSMLAHSLERKSIRWESREEGSGSSLPSIVGDYGSEVEIPVLSPQVFAKISTEDT